MIDSTPFPSSDSARGLTLSLGSVVTQRG